MRGRLPRVIEILNDDMPFLVDSVMGELQARGIAYGCSCIRSSRPSATATGALQAAGPGDRDWSDGHQESYIAIHCRSAFGDARHAISSQPCPHILDGVRVVVADWQPMLERVRKAIRDLEANPPGMPATCSPSRSPSCDWLEADNFTFLGAREFRLRATSDRAS